GRWREPGARSASSSWGGLELVAQIGAPTAGSTLERLLGQRLIPEQVAEVIRFEHQQRAGFCRHHRGGARDLVQERHLAEILPRAELRDEAFLPILPASAYEQGAGLDQIEPTADFALA